MALDKADKVKRFLARGAFIAPMVFVFLFLYADTVETSIYFSVVALALLAALAITL